MSGAVIAANTSIKVNRAISGADTVSANAYAEVDYAYTSGVDVEIGFLFPIKRIFGPAQSIPATITVTYGTGGAPNSVTYSVVSGVEFINSP